MESKNKYICVGTNPCSNPVYTTATTINTYTYENVLNNYWPKITLVLEGYNYVLTPNDYYFGYNEFKKQLYRIYDKQLNIKKMKNKIQIKLILI